jgi:hypothetical protein
MNDYFDQVEQRLRDAVHRRAHLPWYLRVRGISRARGLVVVIVALAVAAPAIGAVTNWYGIGTPNHFRPNSPTADAGRAVANTSQVLPLRIADPQGGPAWGLRVVHTNRGDVCLQFGRVEDGQLGSIGIDYAWDDDHRFHSFPATFEGGWGLECGTTDGAGHGFLNVVYSGIASSASPGFGGHGPQGKTCASPQYWPSRIASRFPGRTHPTAAGDGPPCPRGASRIVFMGLLGPDATSITYQAPDGATQIEKTSGDDGGYLLVFPLNQRTCNLYSQGPTGARGPCGGSVWGGGGGSASPGPIGAVRAIHYKDGTVCTLRPPSAFIARYAAFIKPYESELRRVSAAQRQVVVARARTALLRFLRSQHLSLTEFDDAMRGICPAIGYVALKEKHLTQADVASPIDVRVLPDAKWGPEALISFTARQPVRTSSSWYEIWITNPRGCPGSSSGPLGYGNVRVGQRLTSNQSLAQNCKGVYHGVIGYTQDAGPTDEEGAGSGGTPGQDGSIVVGRFSFRYR